MMREQIQREVRIGFSPRAQPVWFRVIKWIVILSLAAIFWRKPAYWLCLLAVLLAGLPIHFLYRFETKCWTRPWGGWNDLEAGRVDR